jgi:hypothetical protein
MQCRRRCDRRDGLRVHLMALPYSIDTVIAAHERHNGGKPDGDAFDATLNRVAGQRFYNHTPLDFVHLKAPRTT